MPMLIKTDQNLTTQCDRKILKDTFLMEVFHDFIILQNMGCYKYLHFRRKEFCLSVKKTL